MDNKLIFIVLIITLISSSFVSAYDFENKQEFVNFLKVSDKEGLDLRNEAEDSLEIKQYAEKYNVDLNYYENIQLFDSIFSPFSWLLTGFATLETDNIILEKQEFFSGEIIELKFDDNNLPERLEFTIDGNVVASSLNTGKFSFELPQLEPGKHIIGISGTPIKKEFEIKEIEKEDPMIYLDRNKIESGKILEIKGAKFPIDEKNPLIINANDIAIAKVYQNKGVFLAQIDTSLLNPGLYRIYVEGYNTASSEIEIVKPYIKPKIKLIDNLIEEGELIEITGENFEENPEFVLYGQDYKEIVSDISLNKDGSFYKIINPPQNSGEYTITYKDDSSIFVSFKVEEEETLQSLFVVDNSVERGQPIILKGEGFNEEQKIALTREGAVEERIVIDCDEWGRFEELLDTSDYYIGKHKIYLRNNPDVVTYFNINKEKPSPEINFNNKVYEGDPILVEGENFYDYEIISIYVDEDKISDVEIENNEFDFRFENNFENGAHKISVRKGKELIVAESLNIIKKNLPVIKVIGDKIYSEESFKLKGFYFEDNVDVYIDDIMVARAQINKKGIFESLIDLSDMDISAGPHKLNVRYTGKEDIVAFTAIKIEEEMPEPSLDILENEVYENSLIHLKGANFYNERIEFFIDDMKNEELKKYSFFVEVKDNSFTEELNIEEIGLSVGAYKIYSENPISGVSLNILSDEGPTIKLNKKNYVSGENIDVYGQNFEDGVSLLNLDNGQSYDINIDNGSFEYSIDSTSIADGYHKLWVQGYDTVVLFFVKKIPIEPVLIVEPSEIIYGDKFNIKGFNFDKALESIILTIDKKKYTVYPTNGRFNFELDSEDIGLGFHTLISDKYNIKEGFSIVPEVSPVIGLNNTLTIGQPLTVYGQNFEDGQATIFVDGLFVSGVFVEEGEFTKKIDTANMAEGHHVLTVQGENAAFTLKKEIVKMPSLELSHSTAYPGLLIGINGFDFPKPGKVDKISILIDSQKIIEIPYPNEGSFSTSYMITNLDEGEHKISVQGYKTAAANFIFEQGSPDEISMNLFEDEVMPGQKINGVVNGLTPGMKTELDIVINSNKYYDVYYSGIGALNFEFDAPQIPAGEYYIGLAGIDSELETIEILELPEPQQQEYSEQEVKDITEEVQENVLGKIQQEQKTIEDFSQVQNRVISGGIVASLVQEGCVPSCGNQSCGQPDGCGSKCPSYDINEPGKCGNIGEKNPIQQTTSKISEPVSNFLRNNILFIN